ncbi:hypothetical protein Rleg4DRAFT_6041 [Rhizobium leguminosarum bv. trifolii WSM2297]|uniref:Transposase InsH N-terminal domain-containing protein n=1 Tax=Rhizobium leguminosarum bv. trifolii WSM2297 TaxID=754762 RepID=J0CKJ9_RHILT|nr:hypothetical protein Rleg4DRAFT_6041 [Rhizobium leguminosarum bv. trifolii WSM2297]
MRGSDIQTAGLFSYVSCEARVPTNHPLRAIRAIVDEALEVLSPDVEAIYSAIGRPSIPAGEAVACPIVAGLLHDPLVAVSQGPFEIPLITI